MRHIVKRLSVAIVLPLFAISVSAYAAVVPVALTHNCAGGGTRVTTGTYDSSSGALSITTTLTNCIDATNTTHNGTVVATGSLTAVPSGWSMNTTYQFNTHYVNSTEDVQRVCTWAKVGTLDTTVHKFTGTLTKTNCTLTLTDTQNGGDIVEHLQKIMHQTE